MIACRRARGWILLRADARLATEQELALAEHLRTCAACAALEGRAQGLADALARFAEPPLESLDLESSARALERSVRAIGARIDQATPRRARSPRPWLAPDITRVFAVAAAASVLGLLGWRLWGGRDEPAETAASAITASLDAPADAPAPDASAPDTLMDAPSPPAVKRDAPAEELALAPANSAESGAPEALHGATPLEEPLPAPDPARQSAARQALGAILVEALPLLDPAGGLVAAEAAVPARDYAARVTALVRERDLGDFALPRLAQGLLDEPEIEFAAAAARFLGAAGDPLAVRTLQQCLQQCVQQSVQQRLGRPGHPALAPALVQALLDAGPMAWKGLERSLADPGLRELAVGGALARGPAAAAEFLEREASSFPEGELVAALSRAGVPAVGALLRLAESGGLSVDAALATLERIEGAGTFLAESLTAGDGACPPGLGLRAAAALRIDELLPWIARQGREGNAHQRALALQALAGIGSAPALEELLDLAWSGPLDRGQLEAALGAWLVARPESAAELARAWIDGNRRVEQRELLDLLQSMAAPGSAPALIELARSEAIARSDRRTALLLAGELGAEGDAARLAEILQELAAAGAEQAELAAAALIALWRVAGAEAARAALARIAPACAVEALVLLDAGARGASPLQTLFKLERLLEPALIPASS